jgi:anti-sigma regulatory factor (Ser/Thr protein kinase)
MELLSLTGDLTRERALEQLLAPSTSAETDSEMCLYGGSVTRIDAVTAAALRIRLARHEREHPDGSVNLVLPSERDLAARLLALLDLSDTLRARINVTGEVSDNVPANYALVPASAIEDSHAAVALAGFALEACERARLSARRSAFVAAAAMELADNGLIHARQPTDLPVVAITSAPRGRVVDIAVLDTGNGICEAPDPAEILRTIPRRALRGEPGFLGDILQRARDARQQVQVQILAGTGRLLWTPMQHRTERRSYVPGTAVLVRVGGELPSTRSSSRTRSG